MSGNWQTVFFVLIYNTYLVSQLKIKLLISINSSLYIGYENSAYIERQLIQILNKEVNSWIIS